MSFLRHGPIYRSDGSAKPGLAVIRDPGHRFDESAAGYSLAGWSPPEPASASPADLHARAKGGDRQPSPNEGWGIFGRQNGEFSTGIDTRRGSLVVKSSLKSLSMQGPRFECCKRV
jgi:hypothetical protein